MSLDLIIQFLDRFGVFVFALSGGIAAVRHQMDLFGVVFLALLPAIGGGTMRDLILDAPVFWLDDPLTIWLAVAGGLTAFVAHRRLDAFKPLRWADAMGLSVFAITGAAKAVDLGFGVTVVLIMGVMTACIGGLIRDTVANNDPLLLKKDIYATAALVGSGGYFLLSSQGFGTEVSLIGGIAVTFAIRAASIIYNLSLPVAR